MEASELLKKVRKLEIRTKALSHQVFAGEYHSAFKGRGMAFSEVREYQWGDVNSFQFLLRSQSVQAFRDHI